MLQLIALVLVNSKKTDYSVFLFTLFGRFDIIVKKKILGNYEEF